MQQTKKEPSRNVIQVILISVFCMSEQCRSPNKVRLQNTPVLLTLQMYTN